MEAWHWVMRWSDLLGPAPLANLLERCFLPRWLATLSAWLTQALAARRSGDVTAGRVFNEVASWYAGWKAQLPVEVTGYLGVREALSKALSMMDRAMRGLPPQELSAPTAPFGVPGQFPASTPGQVAHLRGPAGLAHLALSQRNLPAATLREQLENTAMERGLLFHPIANRSYEGKQVYLLERIHIYFDRNVAFHLNTQDGEWYPISLTDLLDKIS
ncbi:unnamed protein product [Protopolystoma xenopodis]|uniref:GCF C-terminal domain-containing protein n=1 Tax=Protopolystoma xenopodis TaxID=117903 RepID=A0A448WL92_9PLAT|nr:unnamed protein product [Protopolystoma xenopodis]